MQLACQILAFSVLLIGFFTTVKKDFSGAKGESPAGFGGFASTCIATAIIASVFAGAGTYSELFKLLRSAISQ